MAHERDITITSDDLVDDLVVNAGIQVPVAALKFADARVDELDREYSRMLASLRIGDADFHVTAIEVGLEGAYQAVTTESNTNEFEQMIELSGGGPFETTKIVCPDGVEREYVLYLLPYQS